MKKNNKKNRNNKNNNIKNKKISKRNKKDSKIQLKLYKNLLIFTIILFCIIISFISIIGINYSIKTKDYIKNLKDKYLSESLNKNSNKNLNDKISKNNNNINNNNNNLNKSELKQKNGEINKNNYDYKDQNKLLPDKIEKLRVCIILDDAGYSIKNVLLLKELENLKINISILPFLEYSEETLEIINKTKNLFPIIHIPLEPKDNNLVNDYNGIKNYFILEKDSYSEIEEKIKNIYNNLPLSYCNNHMGSKFSENKEKALFLLNILKDYNINFIDSKTSNKSKFYEASLEVKNKILINNIFLDNENDLNKIKSIFFETINYYKKIIINFKNNNIDNNRNLISLEEIKNNNYTIIFIGHITKENTIKFLIELSKSDILNEIELLFVNEI